ncbi:MAG: aminotransferase class V-fold PLP-dependent enzyme [Anaerosomatales bacterium]|nr:aminotransferase class V-fold PLP-dependent enzyme [Anaerosomatales bacterium]
MPHDGIIYLDHAATSWPKPPEVLEAITHALGPAGGNPNRSAHRLALAAARLVLESRSTVASFLGVRDARNLLFVPGCTFGLNMALKGLLEPGDRVVVSSVEHNAVVRPLAVLEKAGVEVVRIPTDRSGRIDLDAAEALVAARPTKAVVCQHASNVTGAIQPIGDLADIAHDHGAILVVDGAQAAGHLKVDVTALGADVYVASGHKGLLGPQGVGVVYIAPALEVRELVQGGSGGDSGSLTMPAARPDRYEAGTPPVPAIAGLGAAVEVLSREIDALVVQEQRLVQRLVAGLAAIDGVRVLGPAPGEERAPVASIVHASVEPDRLAYELDSRYGIAVRAGLHCAPAAHAAAGTLETGAVRFSIGRGVTEADVDLALEAVREVCSK